MGTRDHDEMSQSVPRRRSTASLATAVFVLAVFGSSWTAEARPVSYPGGWTVMQETWDEESSLLVHYTVNRHWALGLRGEWDRDKDMAFLGPQANIILFRENAPASQTNVYLKTGAGMAWNTVGPRDEKAAGFASLSADWEDRRFMVMYEAEIKFDETDSADTMQMARAGFAPYVGDYGDLHTWLFVELRHEPESEDPLSAALIARLFYQTTLVEAGITDAGDPVLNFQIRF